MLSRRMPMAVNTHSMVHRINRYVFNNISFLYTTIIWSQIQEFLIKDDFILNIFRKELVYIISFSIVDS